MGGCPLTIAAVVFLLVITWYQGRERANCERVERGRAARGLHRAAPRASLPVGRVPGVAVFLSPSLVGTPLALQANVEHNDVLHEHVIIVEVDTERAPRVETQNV